MAHVGGLVVLRSSFGTWAGLWPLGHRLPPGPSPRVKASPGRCARRPTAHPGLRAVRHAKNVRLSICSWSNLAYVAFVTLKLSTCIWILYFPRMPFCK